MRVLGVLILLMLVCFSCKDEKRYHDESTSEALVVQKRSALNDIRAFQQELNASFKDATKSPLKEKDLKNFTELDFFAIDTTYRVTAKFVRTPDESPFSMPTTTDRLAIEVKYGEVHFNLKGKKMKLDVYQSPDLIKNPQYRDYLFLPFTDESNGETTYGGGRYIDLKLPEGEEMIIDFNKAYNPYCAYNEKYSCPIPPASNDLEVLIAAGVKAFKK